MQPTVQGDQFPEAVQGLSLATSQSTSGPLDVGSHLLTICACVAVSRFVLCPLTAFSLIYVLCVFYLLQRGGKWSLCPSLVYFASQVIASFFLPATTLCCALSRCYILPQHVLTCSWYEDTDELLMCDILGSKDIINKRGKLPWLRSCSLLHQGLHAIKLSYCCWTWRWAILHRQMLPFPPAAIRNNAHAPLFNNT